MATRAEFKIARDNEYKNYIDEHIRNVVRAYDEIKEKCSGIPWVAEAIAFLDESGKIEHHDESKYSDEEFDGYRMKFYPLDDLDKKAIEDTDVFKDAWKHHYLNNDHHWNFWVHDGVAENMHDDAIVHMVADWQGMTYKFGDNAKIWFDKQTDINLSEATRVKVEEILIALCE